MNINKINEDCPEGVKKSMNSILIISTLKAVCQSKQVIVGCNATTERLTIE